MTNEERENLINSILPDTVKGQQRPTENLNPDMPYSTDFPQLINKDPASADVFNMINRQLLSNDKNLNDSKADKTYVDKKVADLVNGAPEQLDTLQELSKALNNDKDYATTVNNALAEKLGKREKAVSARTADNVPWSGVTNKPSTYPPSGHNHDNAYPATNGSRATGTWGINISGKASTAGTADSANTLEGVPLSHGGDSVFGKIPVVGDDGVLEIGKYIDFHSKNGDKKDYSTRIEANDDGTISISGGVNANLNGNASSADTLTGFTRNDGHTWGNETGELVANFYLGDGAEIAFKKNNPSAGKTAILIDGIIYQNDGLFQCIDENSINDYLKNYLPLSGGAMEGYIHKSTNDTALILYGGKGFDNGGELALYGKDLRSTNDRYPGGFRLTAMNGIQNCPLLGSPDGSLIWNNTDLAGAGIVSQQLSRDASYIKYANGLLVQFGTMQVQGYAGAKSYIKTLPVSFKEVYSLQATLGYPSAREVSSVQIESDLTMVKLWIYNFVSSSDSVTIFYCHWLMIGSWK